MRTELEINTIEQKRSRDAVSLRAPADFTVAKRVKKGVFCRRQADLHCAAAAGGAIIRQQEAAGVT